jgi:hypothetical protein
MLALDHIYGNLFVWNIIDRYGLHAYSYCKQIKLLILTYILVQINCALNTMIITETMKLIWLIIAPLLIQQCVYEQGGTIIFSSFSVKYKYLDSFFSPSQIK